MQINENLSRAVCLNCRTRLGTFEPLSHWLQCGNCGHRFPVMRGGIPILMRDYKKHLAGSYLEIEAFVEDHEDTIKKVERAAEENPERLCLLRRVVQAHAANNRYLRSIQASIREHVPNEEIDRAREVSDRPTQYPIDKGLACFHRDWEWECGTEQEVSTTMGWLLHQIDEFACDLDTVLVPGAGAGRVACEIVRKYKSCYALDDSFHIASNFYNLLDGDVTIYDVNLWRNVAKSDDVVIEHALSLDPPGSRRVSSALAGGKFCYFVGDAVDVPLADESVSAIICVYFIDIVPVRPHLVEIKRLLKPGGLFLNFGPLRYTSRKISDMLSGEELLSLFEQSGFDILADGTVTNTQFADSARLTQIVSRNFAFAARKRA